MELLNSIDVVRVVQCRIMKGFRSSLTYLASLAVDEQWVVSYVWISRSIQGERLMTDQSQMCLV